LLLRDEYRLDEVSTHRAGKDAIEEEADETQAYRVGKRKWQILGADEEIPSRKLQQ
jgi:hypothetical protein